MKEKIKYDCNASARGKACIEYTDAVTGRILEQIKGSNHVFTDELFNESWASRLGYMPLVLSNSARDVDTAFPFLPGSAIGFGKPTEGASGSIKGNYITAASYLRQPTVNGVAWKYKYEFGTSQVLEPIKSLGLTQQYLFNEAPYDNKRMRVKTGYYYNPRVLSDGTYLYTVTSTGIITKMNPITGESVQVDISTVGGTTGYKYVGFAPLTGKYYIANTTSKALYVYTDNTFTSLETTISSLSNMSFDNVFLIFGDILIYASTTLVNKRFNIATNAFMSDLVITRSAYSTFLGYTATGSVPYTMGVPGLPFFVSFGQWSSSASWFAPGHIYDMVANELVAEAFLGTDTNNDTNNRAWGIVPFQSRFVPYMTNAASEIRLATAVTHYKLPVDAPERPAGSGMSITYELEVEY